MPPLSPDVWCLAEESLRSGRLDCVRASEHCLKEQVCSTKYRTMRQCVAGVKESNFSMVARLEAKDECRSAMDAIKQSPLYHCRCKRGMKKEKNCLRIYWGIYQTLQGNDFLEDSPYEPVNSRLSDIFRLAPIIDYMFVWVLSKGQMAEGGEERHRKKQERWEPPERSLETHNDDGERGREANVAQRVKDKHQTPLCCPGETAGLTDESRAESNRKYKCLKFMRLIQRERRQTDGEPAVARENNCLNAAKACNLNDTCKKYRSAYISRAPAGCRAPRSATRGSATRRCGSSSISYGMLYCSCPVSDQSACSERRRQTIVPVCSYEEKQKPNCLELQASRLADFFVNCQPEPRSLSGCLKENYADCLLSYSGIVGDVSPFCDCNNSGNNKDECDKLTEFFTENTASVSNAIQAFGNGTDVGVWQPMSPVQTTTPPNQRKSPNTLDNAINTDPIYHFCGSLQAQKLKSNSTVDGVFCVDPQIDNPSTSNAILRNSAVSRWDAASLLPPLVTLWYCSLRAISSHPVL
ncbi:hypothetical protein F7725_023669 [Dissostichus mawsoni]|uniref:GDNF/GAS1 domain-containing protein n=1 Tax=Dissostichus mawsoni TaxID=36200 RepID=A0A7J5Y025_DISMA|nr:hypothetical protein F7725_023669 [Dissostichus mawsoni]